MRQGNEIATGAAELGSVDAVEVSPGADRTLEALLERVKGLSGPDRETDRRIDAFFDGRIIEEDTYLPTGSPCLVSRNPEPPHDAYVVWLPNDPGYARGPSLTASLDAVVALCERFEEDTPNMDAQKLLMRALEMDDHEPWLHMPLSGWLPLALLAALLEALMKARSPSLAGG